jgi:hypothetical protein
MTVNTNTQCTNDIDTFLVKTECDYGRKFPLFLLENIVSPSILLPFSFGIIDHRRKYPLAMQTNLSV